MVVTLNLGDWSVFKKNLTNAYVLASLRTNFFAKRNKSCKLITILGYTEGSFHFIPLGTKEQEYIFHPLHLLISSLNTRRLLADLESHLDRLNSSRSISFKIAFWHVDFFFEK